jgi:hypothetical protein
MIKPMSAEEVRAWIRSLPAAHQPAAVRAAWSCHDGGINAGLVGQARLANPFETMLPAADQVVAKPKGKAR